MNLWVKKNRSRGFAIRTLNKSKKTKQNSPLVTHVWQGFKNVEGFWVKRQDVLNKRSCHFDERRNLTN